MTGILKRHAVRVNNSLPRLYHISFRDDLEGIWEPKEPDGDYNPAEDASLVGEVIDKRISLSPTIEQCFQGVFANVKHLFTNTHKTLTFNVYSPKYTGNELIVTPEKLTSQKFVHDAHITKEHCIITKVNMVKIGTVSIEEPNIKDKIDYYAYGIKDNKGYYGWLPGNIKATPYKPFYLK